MSLLRLRPPSHPEPGQPYLVGLTGGIGTGKSTVAEQLAALGAVVVSADELAREVVAPGSPGLEQLAREFGPGVVQPDGQLDRAAMAQLVFDDPAARLRLEQITHPLIAAAKTEQFAGLAPGQVGVYDVPLLVETGMEGEFDAVVVVEAPLDLRLARLHRRGLPNREARARIEAQATDEERRALAHFVLVNDGDRNQLDRSVLELGRELGLAER